MSLSLVKKYQARITSMDEKIHYLYAKGLSTRDIVDTFQDMSGADVSAALISKVTEPSLGSLLSGNHAH